MLLMRKVEYAPVIETTDGSASKVEVRIMFVWKDGKPLPVTTLAEEKRINTFLRLTSPSVIAKLREAFPDLPERPDPKTVFVKLRELRNSW